jgi:hypothetical protein
MNLKTKEHNALAKMVGRALESFKASTWMLGLRHKEVNQLIKVVWVRSLEHINEDNWEMHANAFNWVYKSLHISEDILQIDLSHNRGIKGKRKV